MLQAGFENLLLSSGSP